MNPYVVSVMTTSTMLVLPAVLFAYVSSDLATYLTSHCMYSHISQISIFEDDFISTTFAPHFIQLRLNDINHETVAPNINQYKK